MKFSIALSVITFSLLITSCTQNDSKQEAKKQIVDSVSVFTLKKEPVNKQILFPAELTPFERAEIYAKVGGYINELKVDIGDHVEKGQILVILDAPELISNYAQANSDAQTARSKYQTSLDAYKRILNAAKVNGTIATGELERVKNQMSADSSSFESAKSKLSANAQLKDYLTIRSPYNGIVTQRNVDPGTLVGTNNTKPLLIVENVSMLRLRIPVPEVYTAAIPDTSVIKFSVDAQPGKTYTAILSRKSGAINLTNRTETWEFIYQNTNNQLKSGMYANASIKLGRKELSFLVPASAIATNQEKRFVIRLKEGKTEWIDVKNGISQNDKVEIFGSLNEGDIILLRATDEINQGKELIPKFQSK
ncbi:MAG: efflux RND transporter periplasmic adaptor subunit [Bacteroidota bacterium]|nr:efflux RND transporter periplasmic adaptor subunit [Bacteroidota bacterium]